MFFFALLNSVGVSFDPATLSGAEIWNTGIWTISSTKGQK